MIKDPARAWRVTVSDMMAGHSPPEKVLLGTSREVGTSLLRSAFLTQTTFVLGNCMGEGGFSVF